MEIGDSHVPPGFRFHPTEEELVGYYLKRKINSLKIDLDVIVEIDLYKIEPWDIEDKCKYGYEDQSEWYFFSHKDKKYPTGTRTNRATTAGFWKATGRDKAILSKDEIIGMRKTLVFYKGRAPNGKKSDWIMHEYRLQTSLNAPPQEEGWVVCRAFKKPSPSTQRPYAHNPYMTYAHMMTPAASPPPLVDPNYTHSAAFHRHPPPPFHTAMHQQHRQQYDQLQCDYPSLADNQQGLFREDHLYDEWKLSDVFLSSDHIMEQSSTSSSFDPSSGHGGYM